MNQVGVFNSVHTQEELAAPGTLMWISEDAGDEFSEAYQYCVAHAPQIALRSSVVDGLQRAASEVRAIVITQRQRIMLSHSRVRDLREAYPHARILCLLGSCCEGMYAKVLDPVFSKSERIYCHQWGQVLPAWMRCCGAVVPAPAGTCRSVAVVSATPANGAALMDLAESAGAVAFWCRDVCGWQMRRIDAVWWDDSVAVAATADQWSQRVKPFLRAHGAPVHAWIANAPRRSEVKAACDGGVTLTLSKPYQVEPLLSLLGICRSGQDELSASLRVA